MIKDIFYGGEVNYWNNETYSNGDRKVSGVGFSADNLEEINKRLDYYLDYYSNIGYEIRDFAIAKHCKNCNNSGIVYYGKRIRRSKPCPCCKGKPELEVILHWEHWKVIRK